MCDDCNTTGRADKAREAFKPAMTPGGGIAGNQASAQISAVTEEHILDQLFKYHAPRGDAQLRYENLRSAAKAFAKAVLVNVPYGADRVEAIRKIREAVMTANAGVALNGFSL
jgi:hypothetical protein